VNPAWSKFFEWLGTTPAALREVATKYPPIRENTDQWRCYLSTKSPSFHYTIKSYDTDAHGVITLTLIHGSDSALPGIGTFGQEPEQLIPCDCGHWEFPGPEQLAATLRMMERVSKAGR
jgi:hypothetical protein